ncbi:MAG: ABC transporter ATP-binding protein [Actinomycetes bacterium]|jgi:branched-chain amino acid transport system ATP-binding protein
MADRAPLLDVRDVHVRFGGITALAGVGFTVGEGEICGLIGPNGAGKTTMLNVLSGIYRADSGRVTFAGRDLLGLPPHRIGPAGVARTFQNLALFPTMTVLENVMVGAHPACRGNWLTSLLPGYTARSERRATAEALRVLDLLGLAGVALHRVTDLPYGTMKRVELARALVLRPRLLLLDEPAGGLNHDEVAELGELIVRLRDTFGVAVLLVEHHMRLVMGISDRVVVLASGRRIAAGPPAEVQRDPEVIAAYLGSPA